MPQRTAAVKDQPIFILRMTADRVLGPNQKLLPPSSTSATLRPYWLTASATEISPFRKLTTSATQHFAVHRSIGSTDLIRFPLPPSWSTQDPVLKVVQLQEMQDNISFTDQPEPVFIKLVVASPYAPPSACLVSAMAGVSGFNQTVPTGVQLRVWRDQRAGC